VLSERGVDAVDAPVSGGEPAAREGNLSIMAGGSEEAVERARPIFEVLGKATTHIGPAGAGQVAKAANQVVVALTIQAVAEALTLARKAGVDPARVRAALLGGFAQSRILDLHGQRMLDGAYDPGFKLRLHRKDLAIALQLGREEHAPLFATAQAAELMDALLAQGAGDRDHSALATVYEQLAGVAEGVGTA
jgi:2-hydroxy-3-oxopropionate reductase